MTAYQSDWAIMPECNVCGLQLLITWTIAAKSLQDFCDCAQCSWMPVFDS